MSLIGTILNDAKTALQTAAPGYVVTRTLRDFGQRQNSELQDGVFTLLSRGQPEAPLYNEFLDLLLVGQVLVPAAEPDTDDTAGEQIEEAELAMLDAVKCFARGLQGAQVQIGRVQQSMQVERPYAWITVALTLGPFDLSCVPDPATLDPFVTFHADWDMAPPDGQIDATDDVTLEQP